MTEHPIIFSTPMVRAILDGRKTQTRRVARNQPSPGNYLDPCPYGVPGDRLWVRETWAGNRPRVCYKADMTSYGVADAIDLDSGEVIPDAKLFPETVGIGVPVPKTWRPSIHMPRWATRLFLIVDDVRVQRVQEISEADAVAEGFNRYLSAHCWEGYQRGPDDTRHGYGQGAGHDADNPAPPPPEMQDPERIIEWTSARQCFERTWDTLNAGRGYGWDTNPWVWAITFHREKEMP